MWIIWNFFFCHSIISCCTQFPFFAISVLPFLLSFPPKCFLVWACWAIKLLCTYPFLKTCTHIPFINLSEKLSTKFGFWGSNSIISMGRLSCNTNIFCHLAWAAGHAVSILQLMSLFLNVRTWSSCQHISEIVFPPSVSFLLSSKKHCADIFLWFRSITSY